MVEIHDLLALFQALDRHRVDYVLVGGIAGILLGIGRTTEDVDLFVRPSAENVAAVRAALRDVFAGDESIDEISVEDLAGDYPTIRYGPPHGHFYIDIMARLGEAVAYADLEWRIMLVDGIPVRVATPRTLYRMKCDTVRTRDRADAETLKQLFPDEIGD